MPKLSKTQSAILVSAAQREDGSALPLPDALKIKGDAGTRALEGLRKKGLLEEKSASRTAAQWREDADGGRMMLVITDVGRSAIGGGSAINPGKQPAPANGTAKKPSAQRQAGGRGPKGGASAPTVRQGTKQAMLVDLLRRKQGATIAEVSAATGWQAHSVRGAISGALKKKLGLNVTSEKVEDRGRVYRITGSV